MLRIPNNDKTTKTPPRGKLYNKIHNTLKKLHGYQRSGKKRKSDENNFNTISEEQSVGKEQNSKKEETISKLKTLSINNKDEIFKLWEETHDIRKEETDIAKFLRIFQCYHQL